MVQAKRSLVGMGVPRTRCPVEDGVGGIVTVVV